MAHLFAKDLCGLKWVGDTRDEVTDDRVAALTATGLCDSISINLKGFSVQLGAPVIWLIKESLILLLQVPEFVSLIRLKARVELWLSSKETLVSQECLQLLGWLASACLMQHNIRAEEVLLANKKLHNEWDDFSDVGCHRCVIAMHLVDDRS